MLYKLWDVVLSGFYLCAEQHLAAGEAGIAVGPADDEAAAGVQVEDGLLIQVLLRHHLRGGQYASECIPGCIVAAGTLSAAERW